MTWSRFLCLFSWLGCLAPLWAGLPEGYDNIFLERHASPEVVSAAQDLAGLLKRSTGQSPVVRRVPFLLNPKGLYIGPDPQNPAFDEDPLTDEILIERTPRGLEIRGSDNTTTQFAVYRFAEEYLGWRYYQPGPTGLERLDKPPSPPGLRGKPEVLLLSRADYLSRNPYSLIQKADNLPNWRDWHGLRERFRYNHTLHKILPPTRFDTHPQWFAKDASGKPMRPPYYPRVHGYNDHPDLSNREVRDYVAEQTIRAIEGSSPFVGTQKRAIAGDAILPRLLRSPGLLSISLSLGDSFVFGSFGEDYPWDPAGTFRRWPDWSNHVFAYTNSVAARVVNEWNDGRWAKGEKPQILIGALAYLNWENVPDFPLHPSIVPYLTYDRSQWYDPAARADDLANVSEWNRSNAPFLGTWDYLFGYGFVIPRSMTRIVADSIPALHERGVRAYFSQIAAIWPYDGHTNWLLARLLWDTDLDADALLDEYFREFYGPAASSMRAFFDHAESVWMNQGGEGWWLRYWKDPWQTALYNDQDLDVMTGYLEQAEQAAAQQFNPDTDSGLPSARFSTRVRLTRTMFGMTQALYAYQASAWKAAAYTGPDLAPGLELFVTALNAREELIQARDSAVRESPLLNRARDLSWVFRYGSVGGPLAAFCLEHPDEPEATQLMQRWARIQRLEAYPSPATKEAEILYDNEIRHFDDPRIWHRQFMDSEGRLVTSLSGGGMAAENVRRGHTYQLFRATPGHFYLGEATVRTRQSPSGEVYIKIDFFDADNKLIAESPRARISPVDRHGERQVVKALMQAPATAAYGRLLIRFYEMDPDSRAEVTRAAVYQLDPVEIP